MLSFYKYTVRATGSAALFLFASVMAHAAIIVTPTVTSLGAGLYQYAYSISNTGTSDALVIDISVPQTATAVTGLTAPAGFLSQFDSVLGLASFLENTSSFTATPTSGFLFDSTFAPGTAGFSATVADSLGNLSTITGSTTAPVMAAVTVAPEPGYLYLLAFMMPLLLMLKRRKAESVLHRSEIANPMESLHVSNG